MVGQLDTRQISAWCTDRGVLLQVKNNGEHWMFKVESHIYEWWPSTGRMVADKKWKKAKRLHSLEDVVKWLAERIPVLHRERPAYLDRLEELDAWTEIWPRQSHF